MWKYVGKQCRVAVELKSYNTQLRSNFGTSGPCIGIPSTDDDSSSQSKICVRRYQFNKTGINCCNVKLFGCKPTLRSKIFERFEGRKQEKPEWGTGYGHIITAGFFTSICVGQLLCLYSRRRQLTDDWHQIDEVLLARRINQIFTQNEHVHTQSVYEKSYVPVEQSGLLTINKIRALPASNDHKTAKPKQTPPIYDAKQNNDINAAVAELIKTLGHTEFQLGIQNVAANELHSAVAHFKSAAVHHHSGGIFNLGVCYELGVGVSKNKKNAMECYRAAANLGHEKALYNMGVFYAHGHGGLKKNRETAKAYFEEAGKKGVNRAVKMLRASQQSRAQGNKCTLKSEKTISLEEGQNTALAR